MLRPFATSRPSTTPSTTRRASVTSWSTGSAWSPMERSPRSGPDGPCAGRVPPSDGSFDVRRSRFVVDCLMPAWLLDLFARYGYAVVFGGVFLENTGLPVPGETALLAGAALAHFGQLSLFRVIVTAIAAAILGDNLGFFIGRRLGRGVAARHCWRVGLTPHRLAQFDWFFERHG